MSQIGRLATSACLGVAFAAHAALALEMTEQWRAGGFTFPEATEVLPDGTVAVSDRGAGGSASDGRIARIAADSTLIAMDWVTGLVNPLGMAVLDGRLYVVDGAVGLQVIDIETGQLLDPVPLPGIQLANDIATAPDGTLYVTDTIQGGVMQVRDGTAGWLARPGTVPAANGIAWVADRLLAGTMGEGLDVSDFSVEAPGGLVSVDVVTGAATPVEATERCASVDGVVSLDGAVVYNDNPSGRVLALGAIGITEIGRTEPESGAMSGSGTTLIILQLRAGYVAGYLVE